MTAALYKVHVQYRWREGDLSRGINEAVRIHGRALDLLASWKRADAYVNAYLNERDEPQGTMVIVMNDRNAALLLKLALA